MNVNLSNVSATSKTSVSDSAAQAPTENAENKGFLETLTDAFSGSQKSEKVATKSQNGEEQNSAEVNKLSSGDADSQDTVTDVAQESSNDAEEFLAQESHQEQNRSGDMLTEHANTIQSDEASLLEAKLGEHSQNDADVTEKVGSLSNAPSAANGAKSAMGEGQQLLGRIEQANQTLKANNASIDSGKVLPQRAGLEHSFNEQTTDIDELALNDMPSAQSLEQVQAMAGQGLEPILDKHGQPIDVDKLSSEFATWQGLAKQVSHPTEKGMVSGDVANELSPLEVGLDGSKIDALQHVSLDELELIDTKLAQGKPLTQQEAEIIEGLKKGTVIADIPEQDLAQFVALPTDVKQVLAEQQVQHHLARQAAPMGMSQQALNFAPQSAQPQAVQSTDKVALSPMPDALAAAHLPTALQGVKDGEINQKVVNAALAAGALKATADKQDKPELQHGLAGQLQAMAGQQGTNVQQQARIDAAQQAQLPLQLTKELANEQVAEKVQMMMSKNLKNLDIRLDPPELGRMQIRMTMNNDVANVHFTVNNPQARDIIEQTLPRLREMLAQQGMQLADSSVQQQNSGQQQGRYTAEQHGQSAQGSGFSGQPEESFDADVNLDLNVASKRDGISFYA
ncbi:TPA: flagellar hook-length control protein FliK [Vibrio diabolicus]|uniref:flagellar hook-length control protein FliK n=1 Tax=Vibrio diabolicus TaxID=50719 RepID=UPI00080F57DB|nr:flagellar hook-length control protein FliK [Vibrio diabolicus]MCS0316553.1 flagellar hook-length control protein FliK [Vibrio diabolicus]MCS0345306.1 flagellar hook-length control protein FliK [Vibrio diabolicus]OCH71844.1 flagellar hook-length control protein FliK [Vibrio diabolicus]